jgi:sulfur-oxidizing protein SoxA
MQNRVRIALAAALLAVHVALGAIPTPLFAQTVKVDEELAKGRAMLAADNPGELWELKGGRLFHEKRGPKNTTLEKCDFGLGPGKLEGAFARLPRYFPDTDRVQDLESRLLTCMVMLQGFKVEDIKKNAFSTLSRNSDMEALASFVAARSNGMKLAAPLSHAKEKEMYAAGEKIFYRRNGPMDFACATCHDDTAGKRIRLQDLPNMNEPKVMREVMSTWPAYRGTQSTVRTMQHRLFDCNWQMRLPPLDYASDFSIALSTYLTQRASGGVVEVPGSKR